MGIAEMQKGMEVSWEQKDGISIATLPGRIDARNANETLEILESGIGPDNRALILNFEKVSLISSAGLRVGLVLARKFDKPGKHFGICTLQDPIRNVLISSGFDRIIPLFETQDAAINAFETGC